VLTTSLSYLDRSIFLGPFVNDAINDITKKKAEETTAYSDIHFSVKQEREADVVSLRRVFRRETSTPTE
jgi:hypothetical protein